MVSTDLLKYTRLFSINWGENDSPLKLTNKFILFHRNNIDKIIRYSKNKDQES